MFNKIKERLKNKKYKCYLTHKNEKDICYGQYSPNPQTDDLALQCIGCPYHTLFETNHGL